MAPEWVRRTRLVIGLGVPILVFIGLGAMVVRNGLGPGGDGWGDVGSGLIMLAAIFGPFPLYALGLRSTPFTLLIGAALLGVAVWAIYGMSTSDSSTAGLALFLIPMIGYPLVGVTIFIEWVSGVD